MQFSGRHYSGISIVVLLVLSTAASSLPAQQPASPSAPIVKTHPVPSGNAEAVAKTLQETFKHVGNFRVVPVGDGSIMVWALPQQHEQIARQLQAASDKGEVLPLSTLKAGAAAKTLQALFAGTATSPAIEADISHNSIVVKGTPRQVAEIKAALKALGEAGPAVSGKLSVVSAEGSLLIKGTPGQLAAVRAALQAMGEGGTLQTATMRVVVLRTGNAVTVAEALQRLLPRMRKNPVDVLDPVSGNRTKKKEGSAAREQEREDQQLLSQLVDPQQDKMRAEDDRPGRHDMPVTITAFGNMLIVTSNDPEALGLVQELVHLLTETRAGEGDFQVIKLRNANAFQTAQVLDELFNGQTKGKDRIRVVADTATNSLLVKASPIDLLTIRSFLSKAVDTGEPDSRALMRTWVVGPLKYARAVDVARVLREVYRESINNSPAVLTVTGGPFGFMGTLQRGTGVAQNIDPNGNPAGVTLSIGVDNQTNTLVLQCSKVMYEDIQKLVTELETASADSTRTVKVMSLRNVDPRLVQQAIEAIQGRRRIPVERTGTSGNIPPEGNGIPRPGTFPEVGR
jgi:type II secretory pathway component GspD/PulD (secretin)